jgi:hypothetical protein
VLVDELLELAVAQAETLFVHAPSGRIVSQNDPLRSPAPRLYIGGRAAGNVVRIRDDVDDGIADAILALATSERPLHDATSSPLHLDDYVDLLARQSPVVTTVAGVSFVVPDDLDYVHDVPLVRSGTADGERILARITTHGMPAALAAAGYTEFWEPWCAALHDGEIVSVVETVRDAPVGVEAGVTTIPAMRGRGFAAAAAAGWALHPALRDRVRFYSTQRTNVASQRVAARPGLRFLGASVQIT